MKMIKLTEEQYILTDDSDIRIGNIVAEKLLTGKYELFEIHTLNDVDKLRQKKIVYSTQPLEDYARADGKTIKVYVQVKPFHLYEVKELIGVVDMEKRFQDILNTETPQEMEVMLLEATKHGFKYGYNQALEDNKDKKYTEEDMRNLFALTLENALSTESHTRMISDTEYRHFVMDTLFNRLIVRFQPQTEWEVEFIDGKLKLKP